MITVGVIFGGRSAEHEVSLNSAKAVFENIDRQKYRPLMIHISREDGRWRSIDEERFVKKDFESGPSYSFLPWLNIGLEQLDADIYFPVLHGPNGEDGRIQGLLELAGKPFVGADSLSSKLSCDKVAAKILLQHAGINVVDYLYFESDTPDTISQEVSSKLKFPVFVKPSSMGSSVGISKVGSQKDLKAALEIAFRYDRKVIVEKGLNVREVEVSVMGNGSSGILVSPPGELVPNGGFYDYSGKYLEGKTTFYMPAKLEPQTEEEIRSMAEKAYKALFLNGMSRVDLFIDKDSGTIYLNEINSIPGFTEISMFPKLWGLQGITFTELITRLIDYGFEFYREHVVDTQR